MSRKRTALVSLLVVGAVFALAALVGMSSRAVWTVRTPKRSALDSHREEVIKKAEADSEKNRKEFERLLSKAGFYPALVKNVEVYGVTAKITVTPAWFELLEYDRQERDRQERDRLERLRQISE